MRFVLIFGPQAVGKMTVGQELAKITHLKLLHNHMTIDPLVPLFGFTPEMWRLCHMFRKEIFKSAVCSNMYGIIFTTVWAFNKKEDWMNINEICQLFRAKGADIYFVELEACTDIRLQRNRTPHRLAEKPTKRNIEQSEQNLLESVKTDRLNSRQGEIKEKNYLRINNTYLNAEQVALKIKQTFHL
ncbi:AAA family ATPase [Sporolactobacillus sp. STSJ-5]|uniref:AAA family ATPase n=1 Tax=Sporolactobacillus sp. STSJ-5 TaxID=2965076 RepID=UPI00210739AC|nr:AAA family ATPase [Sporolactobacillus sp. STSJ-5]MCQ2011333.1 AAA family ATPase [Sporolactobacillus sp. STSJ-5]